MRSYKLLLLTLLIGTSLIKPAFLQNQCVGSLDIMFVIDGSNSMGSTNFRSQINSLNSLLNRMAISDPEIHVGIVIFSSDVQDNVPLTGNRNTLLSQTFNYPDDLTRTDLAISAAVQNFNQYARNGDVPKLMMVITDGVSDDRDLTRSAATAAKNAGINIFAVGVTTGVARDELQDIASSPEQVIITNDFATLEQTLNDATNQACVNLECSNAKIDMAFVLDSSVPTATFDAFKTFVEGFVAFADIASGLVRVAVVTYSDNAQVRIGLNDFRNKDSLYEAIRNLRSDNNRRANAAAALTVVRQQVFTAANGDRGDAPDVLVFVTGTLSTINANSVLNEAVLTRSEGIQIYTVGVSLPSASEIQSISSLPISENSFVVADPASLSTTLVTIFQSFNKFCRDPAPVPACDFGQRDIYLVVDVSSRVSALSTQTVAGDFGNLRTGLSGLVDVINDPSVPNPNIRLGLVTFSGNQQTAVPITSFNSRSLTRNALNSLPQGVLQGGSRLDLALRSITTGPVNSNEDSYIIIVTTQNSPAQDITAANTEAQRLKDLGWNVAIVDVADPSQTSNSADWRNLASSSRLAISLNQYSELDAAMREIARDVLCGDFTITPFSASICEGSGHVENGVSTIAHPTECDKFVQCYYNPNGPNGAFDLAVVRNCPMGLFYSVLAKKCVEPKYAYCDYDRCKGDCEPYNMEGACGAYWACHEGESVPKCCPALYSFVPGEGCVMDFSCRQNCGQESCAEGGICNKRPKWDESAAYDVSLGGLKTWMPHPCLYKDFDIVDCDCSAVREDTCEADREFDFTRGVTFNDPECQGIDVSNVDATSTGAAFDKDSKMNVKVDPAMDDDGAMTLKIRFREADNYNQYGAVLVSSDGKKCKKGGGSLIISIEEGFITAKIKSHHGRMATVSVPTKGIPRNAFKDLTLAYGNYNLALTVKGANQQYVAQVAAPSQICFRCGLNIASNMEKFGFVGTIQQLAVYSCLPPKLY